MTAQSSTDITTLPPLVDRLRSRSKLVFLAADESPAQDMSNHFIEAAATIDALVKALQGFVTAYGSQDESTGGLDKADEAARALLFTIAHQPSSQSAGESKC